MIPSWFELGEPARIRPQNAGRHLLRIRRDLLFCGCPLASTISGWRTPTPRDLCSRSISSGVMTFLRTLS